MRHHALCTALLLAIPSAAIAADFTYRGQLHEDGAAANGRYDLAFTLYADRKGSRVLHGPVDARDVVVKNGQFAVALDLPDFAASGWLEVAVRPVDEVGFLPLGEREQVSLKAASCPAAWELGGNAGTLPGINFLGTTDSQPLELRINNQLLGRWEAIDLGGGSFGANIRMGSPDNVITAGALNSTIAGGQDNLVRDIRGTIGGGFGNRVGLDDGNPSGQSSGTVAGGSSNSVLGTAGAIGGGTSNTSLNFASTVAGGFSNVADGPQAAIGGGEGNVARGRHSSIPGGLGNTATGDFASVSGGTGNCAGAQYSWAGGRFARVRGFSGLIGNVGACAGFAGPGSGDEGTFAWADSQSTDFVSTGRDQFLIRARGGVAVNAPPIDASVELSLTADIDGSDFANLFLRQRSNNAGMLVSAGGATSTNDNNAGYFIDHFNGTAQARRLALNGDGSVLIRSNTTAANTGVTMAANAGAWSSLSDRRLKTAITAIDPVDVLDRLVAIPISTWSYIAQGEAVRHIGPMAQDFAAAFAVGENDTTISTIDADGVALAAIQGLNAKLERENAALREEMAALRAIVEALQRDGER